MEIRNLGLVRYAEALKIMETTHAGVCASPSHSGVLLVVEHPPVVTMGNRPLESDMVIRPEGLAPLGIDFAKIDRGGSVTVHEPGQVVIYPIVRVDAKNLTVKKFVWILEESMIGVCAEFGVTAARDEINPGVWVGQNKIGAIGIRIQDHVSKHGLAFNVTNDLSTFRAIVPCGIRGRGVTSLAQELRALGRTEKISVTEIAQELAGRIGEMIGKGG